MATPTQIKRRGRWSLILGTVFAFAAIAAVGYASNATTSVADVDTPLGSVTLAPGGSDAIRIQISITGQQAGTATFKINRNWSLSGGTLLPDRLIEI